RHAHHADLDVARLAEQRQAHEGRDVAEARRHGAGDGLGEIRGNVGHRTILTGARHFGGAIIFIGRGATPGGVNSATVVRSPDYAFNNTLRADTNSSTAATKRSPSASPIMMLRATKPRRAIQIPAAVMSKKNSSLAS